MEGSLINEIKGLDGERKALVYDNYSKLIAATDTIRNMRNNMEPATPATSTLGHSVGHIADVAGTLAGEAKRRGAIDETGQEESKELAKKTKRERDTVEWVVGTPRRLEIFLNQGMKEDAEKDWVEIKGLLEKWSGVPGVEELRDECQRIMGRT